MNKIYKVVWSKAKHCYVVTSELAKSQTKGCGARSLRMATVSLGVAASLLCSGAVLPIFGESVAEAAVTVSDASDPVNNVTPAGAIGYYDYGTTLLGFNVYTIQAAATTDKELSITGSSNNSVSAQNGFVGCFDLLNNVTGSGASLSNGTVGVLIGGGSGNANVEGNAVTVTGGTVDIGMYGGFSYSGKATGNSIEISGDSTVINSNPVGSNDDYSKVVGGSGKTGASKNTVTIKGGKINSYVYGGYSEDGVVGGNTAAEGNKVIMTGGKVNNYKNIYGGYSKNSNANFNAVTISGGEISYGGCVYGGDGEGNVTNNSVTVSGGSTYDVVGGSGGGNVDNNTVTITGGTVMYVTGGNSGNGTANNNTVDISGGTIGSSYGGGVIGASHGGGGANPTANNNKINIYKNANITGSVKGTWDSYGDAFASGNTITIDGSAVVTGNVAAASGIGEKKQENKVFIKNGSVTGDVYGGLLEHEYASEGSLIKNEVNISGGTVTGDVYGGAVKGNVIGDVKENKINITGGTLAGSAGIKYYGGYGSSGEISGNQIIIESGTFNNNGYLYGGYNFSSTGTTGAVKNNKVIITGVSTASDLHIHGGYTYSQGDYQAGEVTGNTVEISNGKINNVVGGYVSVGRPEDSAKVDNNTVSVSGDAEVSSGITGGSSVTVATNNHVNLSGQSKVGGSVYGGRSRTERTDYASTASAKGNDVTISENAVLSKSSVYGGYTIVGTAESNAVTIKGGTVKEDSSSLDIFTGLTGNGVYGGFSRGSGNVLKNTVTIEGGTVNAYRGVYGGWAKNGTAGGSSADDGNKVSITSGTVSKFVYGGYSVSGNAKFNTVTVSSEAAVFGVVGGYSNTGAVTGNTVSISGGTVSNDVYGGSAKSGTAGGDTANDGNKVTIGSGTVEGTVYGGYSQSGAVTGNTVSITGGTVSGDVYGGYGESGNPTKNSVIISGGTFNGQGSDPLILKQAIFGGYNHNDGSASDNTVTISGGTFIGSNGILIQGGRTYYATGTTNNNIVNLTGTVTGLEKGSLLGGGSSASNTGNELHVGGIKGGANGVWQGKTGDTVNNKVKYVANFDKVVLHSVKWDKDVAALEATTVNNVKTLDITDLKFYTDAAGTTQKTSFEEGESMALLKSVESDLSSVKLDYKSGDTVETVAITTEGVTLGGGATDKTETDGVNGVKLTQSVTEKVKLATDSKAISYSCEVGDVKGVTFNASTPITFSTTEVARDLTGRTFAASNTVNANGLEFEETNEAIAVSDSMTLISNATGITTTVTNETGKTVAITNYEDSQKIKYTATASGTVTSDGSAVKYTVGSVTVSSIDLSGWTGTASDLTQGNTSGWTGAGVSVAGSFTAPDIAANSSQDIVITNKAGFFTVDKIDDSIKYAAVDFSDDEANGVTLAGSQSKGVQAASDGTNDGAKLVYAVGKKDVTGITLGNMKVGTPRTMEAGYDFTGVTTINAGNLQFDKPEDVKANMTLVANATNLLEGKTADHTQDFTKTAANSVALTASLKGTVATVSGAVNYTYSGTELKTINLANWNGSDATFGATGWTKGASATVETDGLSVTVDPGVEKTVLTVSGGVVLTGITVNGEAYQWKDGGESIAEASAENGVKITAGVTTGGGIKGDGNKIIYKGSSKTVTGLEVTSVDFVKDGVARAFKNDYDLTNAAITVASGISVSNTASMNAGDTMVVVDAEKAIANTKGETLQGFTVKPEPMTVDFTDEKVDGKELTFEGTHKDTLSLNDKKTQVVYKVGEKEVNKATFTGEVAWNDSEAYYTNDTSKYIIAATNVDAEDLIVTGTTTKALKTGDAMTLLSADRMTATIATDQSAANKTASKVTVNYKDGQGVAFAAEAKGAVTAEAGAVKYNINEVKLTNVDLSGWTGSESSVPGTWTADDGSVKVAAGSFAEPDVAVGSSRTILTAGGAFFDDANISGTNKYDAANGKAFSETKSNVTVSGTQAKGVATADEGKSLVYKADIKKADTVSLSSMNWQKDAVLFDGSSATEYDYAAVTTIGTDTFDVTYASPETVAAGESMTLLKANETLTAIINEEKAKAYSFSPVSGVTVDAAITGKLANSGNNVVFTAAANQASKLTFGDVEWKDSGALLTRPGNITFAGADVDTSRINFTNMIYLDADRQMTLVSDFGDKVGTITGSKYLVGTAFEGEGAASLSGSDLVFRTKTGAGVSEQTHKTVMATEVGVTMLNTGNDYIDKAMEGMGDLANVAPDGTTVGAAIGGGRNRYETGSHVNVNSWNAAVAVGAKRELKNGSLEYGVFGEYGKANFTLHSDAGKGDGDSHYAGGGLLAKWTNKHDVYTEASFRLGRLSESSSDIMRDGLGNTYGYDVHANYYGAHVGVGKIFRYNGGRSLDVYGKYFYTKRDGVEFDAVQHYNLDSVASSVLRIGARYGTTDKKWNWYGGLAYEYEFDGEAEGVVNGVAIRAASIKGSSVRGEIGMRMEATKTNPWQMDISIYGYGGKHRGIGGNVNVAYTF